VIFNTGVGIRETWIPKNVRVLCGTLLTMICEVITCLEVSGCRPRFEGSLATPINQAGKISVMALTKC
jgi:hypothetical protein